MICIDIISKESSFWLHKLRMADLKPMMPWRTAVTWKRSWQRYCPDLSRLVLHWKRIGSIIFQVLIALARKTGQGIGEMLRNNGKISMKTNEPWVPLFHSISIIRGNKEDSSVRLLSASTVGGQDWRKCLNVIVMWHLWHLKLPFLEIKYFFADRPWMLTKHYFWFNSNLLETDLQLRCYGRKSDSPVGKMIKNKVVL